VRIFKRSEGDEGGKGDNKHCFKNQDQWKGRRVLSPNTTDYCIIYCLILPKGANKEQFCIFLILTTTKYSELNKR
jgi:hypothetical protein